MIAAVMSVVKRQVSKKSGAEYARLVLEDFHGTAEALVFPDAWSRLNTVIAPDRALLLTGSYSQRDRGEDQAPFIVEAARPLDELKASGQIGLALRWNAGTPREAEAARAAAALCAAHPGPAPVLVEWEGESNGGGARLVSRSLRVDPGEELLVALRGILGAESVHLVKAG
jgi:DNA polymerase-3 subunit alpha